MPQRLCKTVSVLLVGLIALPACEWMREHREALIGAGVGTVAGAVAGHAIGGRRGAVVGALLGALAGGAIGEYAFRKDRTAQETKEAIKYEPAQGVRLELQSADVQPAAVAPGNTVNLTATYALMAPNAEQEIAVKEQRLVTCNGVKVHESECTVQRAPSTYTSQVPITLPAGAPRGTYEVLVTVQAQGQFSQKTATFAVN